MTRARWAGLAFFAVAVVALASHWATSHNDKAAPQGLGHRIPSPSSVREGNGHPADEEAKSAQPESRESVAPEDNSAQALCGSVIVVDGSHTPSGTFKAVVPLDGAPAITAAVDVKLGRWCLNLESMEVPNFLLVTAMVLDGREAWAKPMVVQVPSDRGPTIEAVLGEPRDVGVYDAVTGMSLNDVLIVTHGVSAMLDVRAIEPHPQAVATTSQPERFTAPIGGSLIESPTGLYLVGAFGYSWSILTVHAGKPLPPSIFLWPAGELTVIRNETESAAPPIGRLELCSKGDVRIDREAAIYSLCLPTAGESHTFRGIRPGEYSVFLRSSANAEDDCPLYQGDVNVQQGKSVLMRLGRGGTYHGSNEAVLGGFLHGWSSDSGMAKPELRIQRLEGACDSAIGTGLVKLSASLVDGSLGSDWEWEPISVPRGSYLLSLKRPPFSQRIEVDEPGFQLFEMTLEPSVELTARFVDASTAEPVFITSYYIAVSSAASDLGMGQWPRDYSGGGLSGTVACRVPPGKACLWINTRDYGCQTFFFDVAGPTEKEFLLDRCIRLQILGRILDGPADLPVEKWADIQVVDPETGESLRKSPMRFVPSRPNVERILSPSRVDVRVLAAGSGRAQGVHLTVPQRSRYVVRISGLSFELSPAAPQSEAPFVVDLTPMLLSSQHAN